METIKNYSTLLLFLILVNFSLRGQSESDFEKFARDVFTLISDSTEIPPIEYARIKTYQAHIDKQEWSDKVKEELKLKTQKRYPQEYDTFHKKLGIIVNRYQQELAEGASFEFLNYSYEANQKWTNRYQFSTSFILKNADIQSIVRIEHELLYTGKALILIGADIKDIY